MEDDKLAESLALFTRWEGESKFKAPETLEQAKEVLKNRNPTLYREKNVEAIKQRVDDYGIDKKGLTELTQRLVNAEITDLGEFDAAKLKAIHEIGEVGAENKWTVFFGEARKLLEKAKKNVTEQVKSDIKKIQEQMKSFKSGTNSYLSNVYNKNKSEAEKLEKEFNSISNGKQTGSPDKTSWGIIIPVSLAAVALIGIVAVVIVKRRKRNRIKGIVE